MPSTTVSPFQVAVAAVRAGGAADSAAEELLTLLTPEERLSLLDGDAPFWGAMADMLGNGYNRAPIVMGAVERLGIPGLRFSDGPRGVTLGESTAFPVSMARGATWDVALEEQIGLAIGRELRAQGGNFYGGVCVNLPRHPAWGRVQETYGEDPVLLGEFGAALTRGAQRNAMAVVKHFALNSMENARFAVDVTVDDRALHEVYLPHFRRVIEEGVAGVMSSYNSVNGEWAGQNAGLLTDVLRGMWGFEGVTVSDFIWGIRDAALSLRAGLDVEEPFAQLRATRLPADLDAGRASWADVDRAGRRILRTQILSYATRDKEEPSRGVVFSDEHRALARLAAQRSIVLLKNDQVGGAPVLPLDRAALRKVALIGRLADLPNTGDHGSSDVHAPSVVTVREGLVAALPDTEFVFVLDDDPQAAAAASAAADVAIVIAGYTSEDEGEYVDASAFTDPALLAILPSVGDDPAGQAVIAGMSNPESPGSINILGGSGIGGDRASLRLRPIDAEIIRAVGSANPRTVVSIVTGGAVIIEEWRESVPAVVIGWYSGAEGGSALAKVLLGEEDASGRLPFSIPTSEAHLPFFDRDATSVTYDIWFGQRLLDRKGHAAAFPLGWGLSYTRFKLSDVVIVGRDKDGFDVRVRVANTGERAGRHVVQVYGVPEGAGDDFPTRVLLGFAPVRLDAGESEEVAVRATTRPLQRWTAAGFRPASERTRLEIGAFSGDPNALSVRI
ncbi:MAG: glycoside hydrolase family 3 C-terminal domain-containing protein [Bifidobacteriaceae bacterium]|jgi:beta-glucosidase-like glycosyl hydrolase|nr:glycoside hydrolase family 3 C-terminal domain-containing protein [Bifidobacteriaceae bacterium]